MPFYRIQKMMMISMMGIRDQAFARNIKTLRNPNIQFFRAKIFWNEYLKYFEETPDSAIYRRRS